MSDESLDVRLTKEVTTLSTKLVTAVAKSSELEERILHLIKENQTLKSKATELEGIETKYAKIVPENDKLKKDIVESNASKAEAEKKISELENEVEDLTASLFDEANKMVSNASRETYNFKVKNGKLQEELQEKNTIIDNLQDQLKDLKQLFFQIEDQQKLTSNNPQLERKLDTANATSGRGSVSGGRKSISSSGSGSNSKSNPEYIDDDENLLYQQQISAFIYTPNIRSIRFDLNEYHLEFKPFIYTLIRPNFNMDLPSLKTNKYFRRIWTEEIENSIPVVPTPSNFINRWQKGKSFWNLLVEGRAIIAPISGVNETYKLTYHNSGSNNNNNNNSNPPSAPQAPPIATKEPCNFCHEHQDDILEHARLYSLKLINPEYNPKGTSINEQEEVLASYPLCNYCLVKLRNICEFFAKLRLIHTNVHKLTPTRPNHLSTNSASSIPTSSSLSNGSSGASNDTSPIVNQTNRFNRLSGIMGESTTTDPSRRIEQLRLVPSDLEERKEEAKFMKLYVMLISIRAKIFWSKIGYWDNPENLIDTNLEEIRYEAFEQLIGSVESHPVEKEESKVEVASSDNGNESKDKTEKEDKENSLTKTTTSSSSSSPPDEVASGTNGAPKNGDLNISKRRKEFDPVNASFQSDASSIKSNSSRKSSSSSLVKDRIKMIEQKEEPVVVNTESEDDFEDSTEDFDIVTKENKISRKKSSSKQFKKRMDNDLNETLAMLQESLEN